jgi:hypothetical protein
MTHLNDMIFLIVNIALLPVFSSHWLPYRVLTHTTDDASIRWYRLNFGGVQGLGLWLPYAVLSYQASSPFPLSTTRSFSQLSSAYSQPISRNLAALLVLHYPTTSPLYRAWALALHFLSSHQGLSTAHSDTAQTWAPHIHDVEDMVDGELSTSRHQPVRH